MPVVISGFTNLIVSGGADNVALLPLKLPQFAGDEFAALVEPDRLRAADVHRGGASNLTGEVTNGAGRGCKCAFSLLKKVQ